MINSTYPATYHEVGYLLAECERLPWYLIERDEEFGLTPELEAGDDIISIYRPE